MSQVNGAEVVAVVGEAEIPAMPDFYFVTGWDPNEEQWQCVACYEVEGDRVRPATKQEALDDAAYRRKYYRWRKVSVQRVSAPVEGTALDAAWEALEEAMARPHHEVANDDGTRREETGFFDLFYPTKEEARSQSGALRARLTVKMPGWTLHCMRATMGPARVRMRCWMSREK